MKKAFSSIFAEYILFCIILSFGLTNIAIAQKDLVYGTNNGTGYNTSSSYVDQCIAWDNELGLKKVRMGMDGVGGGTVGATFDFAARDVIVNKYLAAGIKICVSAGPRFHTASNITDYTIWKANWDYFIKGVMNHYKGKINYYIVDNEPDLAYAVRALSPQESVDFTKIAWDAAQSIDQTIDIESTPTMSCETDYLRQLVSLGITRYCNYLGVHVYGAQTDDGRLSKPWQFMAQYPQYPQRPVSASECGMNPSYAPAGINALAWVARWFKQFNVQTKRYGYSNVLLFDIDGHGDWAFLNDPAYAVIQNSYLNKSISNAGFETNNDLLDPNDWFKTLACDAPNTPTNINISNTDKHTGSNCLRIDGAGSARQIIGQLTPGQEITISAWVKATNSGTARLTVQGYNNLDGDAELVQSSTSTSWNQLQVIVTPNSSSVVIELKSTSGRCYFDDVTITGGVNVLITNINLSPASSSLYIGSAILLTPSFTPENASNKAVTWSSNDTSIATVSTSGLVTGIAQGSAIITATTQDGELAATCNLTVNRRPFSVHLEAENYSSSGGTIGITGGDGGNIVNYFEQADYLVFDNVNIPTAGAYTIQFRVATGNAGAHATLQSINGSVLCSVPIASNGWSGWQTVSATANLLAGIQSFKIATKNLVGYDFNWWKIIASSSSGLTSVTGVSVPTTSATIIVSGSAQLSALIAPSNATNQNVIWSSGNTAIATVNSGGIVNGVAKGKATITVTTQDGGFSSTCILTVNSNPLNIHLEAENYNSVSGDVSTTGGDGGTIVNWFGDAEYLVFNNVNIPVSGSYKINFRVATGNGGAYATLQNSTGTELGSVAIPNSGWSNWQTVSTTINLAEGSQSFRVVVKNSVGYDINWLELNALSTVNVTELSSTGLNVMVFPNPITAQSVLKINSPEASDVTIRIVDVNGRIVFANQLKVMGEMSIPLNLGNIVKGVYILQIQKGNKLVTKQIVK